MIAIYLLLGVFALSFATWIFYLAIMMLESKKDEIPPVTKFFGMIVFLIGFALDIAFNIMASFIFVELPHEFLFTKRVSRHIKGEGWRQRLAHWFCSTWLEPFDKGHCGG